ncbi:AAA family ATPase [Algiphilus sp.]|uniref:AAA family ATPase n=1 Tax=Algiphilus sp. TaxID=1872431 RepID=UPI0025BFF364|nr:AAA family ATPase [Algiphilus sp.]MCK5771923.1 AAA family ATPase [Algiphilus sp.]
MTARPPPFAVVALMGLPGSGKSTLAARLSTASGLAILDRDAIRAGMFPQHVAGVDEKPAATAALWLALRAMLEAGQGAILDGMTFASDRHRATAAGMAEAFGASFLPVEVRVSLRVATQRVRAQVHSSKERTPKLVRQVASRFQPVPPGTLVIDGREPVEAQVARVCAAFDERCG